uniref:Zinc finger, CCHC-type n=1 Tax=Tanacetum cinerariifolium TaxID=118510 RepID=A0A6L2KH83_TANCI|nr:zinc finger, CCHC-type [Tanacetum cinerariifolium]
MVPTKKIGKTPYEIKVLVARNAEFLKNSLITQEASGSLKDLEIIQEKDTHPSKDTSLNLEKGDLEIDEPQSDIVPIRRSTRTRHAPDQSGSLRKRPTWMDLYTPIKLVLRQRAILKPPGIDYEETFSPVADIRAIRILIAIVAYYDYEIWQMDVKTAFLNGSINEEVYMEKPEGFVNAKYPDRNSKRGSIPMQEKLKLSKSQGASKHVELKRMQNVRYASAVGSIMYAVRCTRPDVAFAQNITRGDLKRELKVSCYTNAGYLTNADDLKSQTGYVVVPLIDEPISMYCDNTGPIAIANKSGITKGARYFYCKVHYLCEVIEYGDVKLKKVHTDDNLADPFTKALAFLKHSKHTRNIGMLPASSLICSWCGGPFNGENCWRCTNVSFGDEFVHNTNPISNDETPDLSYPPSQPQTSSFDQLHCFGCKSHLKKVNVVNGVLAMVWIWS